jgi:hypothetical protein
MLPPFRLVRSRKRKKQGRSHLSGTGPACPRNRLNWRLRHRAQSTTRPKAVLQRSASLHLPCDRQIACQSRRGERRRARWFLRHPGKCMLVHSRGCMSVRVRNVPNLWLLQAREYKKPSRSHRASNFGQSMKSAFRPSLSNFGQSTRSAFKRSGALGLRAGSDASVPHDTRSKAGWRESLVGLTAATCMGK